MNVIVVAPTQLEGRYIDNLVELVEVIEASRKLGYVIVLTSGTFDLIHIGHALYLQKAKLKGIELAQHLGKTGCVMVVGVDSDERTRERKGPNRPVVPEDERVAMLQQLRGVDIVVTKRQTDPAWHLIKSVRPNILITSERVEYSEAERSSLLEFCDEVVVLETQATTSTTARIRLLHLELISKFKGLLHELMQKIDLLLEVGGT